MCYLHDVLCRVYRFAFYVNDLTIIEKSEDLKKIKRTLMRVHVGSRRSYVPSRDETPRHVSVSQEAVGETAT